VRKRHHEQASSGRARNANGTRQRPRKEESQIPSPRWGINEGVQVRDKQDRDGHLQHRENKFAAQFSQSRKNVVNYLQRTSAKEGYLVAETVRTGRAQIIELPPAVDPNAADADDQKIIRAEEVKTIAK
jgi:hypothetical protein